MRPEINLDLNRYAIEELQDLVQINMESYHGFMAASERLKTSALFTKFRILAHHRLRQSEELEIYVDSNSFADKFAGENALQISNAWRESHIALNRNSFVDFVDRVLAGELIVKSAYRSVVRHRMRNSIAEILLEHLQQVEKDEVIIRELLKTSNLINKEA